MLPLPYAIKITIFKYCKRYFPNNGRMRVAAASNTVTCVCRNDYYYWRSILLISNIQELLIAPKWHLRGPRASWWMIANVWQSIRVRILYFKAYANWEIAEESSRDIPSNTSQWSLSEVKRENIWRLVSLVIYNDFQNSQIFRKILENFSQEFHIVGFSFSSIPRGRVLLSTVDAKGIITCQKKENTLTLGSFFKN